MNCWCLINICFFLSFEQTLGIFLLLVPSCHPLGEHCIIMLNDFITHLWFSVLARLWAFLDNPLTRVYSTSFLFSKAAVSNHRLFPWVLQSISSLSLLSCTEKNKSPYYFLQPFLTSRPPAPRFSGLWMGPNYTSSISSWQVADCGTSRSPQLREPIPIINLHV